MRPENAVEIENISKVYQLYQKPTDRVKEALLPGKRSYHSDFFALRDISFSIKKGESVGIIGTNGSGKSTLLKIIVGVLNQSSGCVESEGRISALLELGAGFNMEYTGIENIYFNGTIMGFSHEEMSKRLPAIAEFADIGQFIYQPVKTYSSGMFVRLAFATQIYTDPDILIVDEALSVGDMRFQQKCYRAMENLMKDKTVILVTHDPGAVLRFCRRVIWLEQGELRFDGDVDEGLKKYETYLIRKSIEESEKRENFDFSESGISADSPQSRREILLIPENLQNKGNGDAMVTACMLIHADGAPAEFVQPGEDVIFCMRVEFKKRVPRPMIGMTIRDRLGNVAIGINSDTIKADLPVGEGTMEYEFAFTMPPLNKGQFTISPAVASGAAEDHIQLCWLDDAWMFNVPKRIMDIPGMIYIDQGEIKTYNV